MKKRLLSLVMCLLMIASPFIITSCADDTTVYDNAGDSDSQTISNNTPMTISIYSVRGKGTTDEAIELVEEALTKIAVRRYNTTIDLVLIDEEEYASQMFAKIRMAVNSYNTERLNDKTLDKTEKDAIMASNVDYQYLQEGGLVKGDYYIKQSTNLPSDVLTGELDIFLVYEPSAGIQSLYTANAPASAKKYSMFDILYMEQALAPLKSYLNGEYSEVKSVAYSHALDYVTRPGYKTSTTQEGSVMPDDVFGVPNNYIYGDYEYVIFDTNYVNKIFDGADKQSYATSYESEFKGKENPTGKFAELVKELTEKQGTPGYEYDSVIKYFPDTQAYESYLSSDDTFAIGIVTGPKSIEQLFEQHERLDVYVSKGNAVSYPSSTPKEDLDAYCDSMFCIGTPAMDNGGERAKRCMEILDLLANNKEFRNVFQYGVEGTHFTQYSDEVIPLESPRPESKYFMDMKYTGNMFILYTSAEMDEAMKLMSKNNWQLAKDQNVELVPKRQSAS